VKRILNELVFLEREASFTRAELERNGATLADYGLDQPALTLAFTPAGAENSATPPAPVTLRIGAETKTGNRLYVLSPETATASSRRSAASPTASASRSTPCAPTTSSRSRSSRCVRSASKPPPRTTSASASGAKATGGPLRTPILARASRPATELALNALSTLDRVIVPSSSRLGRPDAHLDLASPALRLTLEGNGRRETLAHRRPHRIPPALRPGQRGRRRSSPSWKTGDAIFTTAIPTALIDTLVRAQENSARPPHSRSGGSRPVSSLTLRARAARTLAATSLEGASSGGDAGNWQIVRRDTGAGGSTTLPADAGAANRLLQHLTLLEAQEFRSDAPSAADLENWGFNRPERESHLIASGPGTAAPGSPAAPPLVLQLGMAAENGGSVQAKLAHQDFVYRVPNSILAETPVAPRLFRDRKLRELPAGAQITGVSLVRLADNATVWTHALREGETWSGSLPPARSPPAAARSKPCWRNCGS
jgi:hypothetical protein